MKVVILAAGQGSRLGHGDLPKPLTSLISGKTILGHQLDALSRVVSLDDVILVVGYHKELIMEAFPNLLYVYNQNFAQENTAKSLLKALKKCHEDLIWLNGDVVFHPAILNSLLAKHRTSLIVNKGSVGDEEVKYRQDTDGRLLEVSKQVQGPQGEALGINYFNASDLPLLCQNLEECTATDYFEKGVENCIKAGMNVWSVCVDNDLCTEVDFPEDLNRANNLLKKWTNSSHLSQ